MKLEKNPYEVFDHYCLRTPLFPLDIFIELTRKESIQDLELIEIFKNKSFNEALFLASPELHREIVKWSNGNITNKIKQERIKTSLLKYITRICSRCTPFGLFASCSTGKFDLKTNQKFKPIDSYKRISRFDMSFLSILSNELLKNDDLRKNLLFYPNTSLYQIGNQYRYVEYKLKNGLRDYSLEGVVYSEYLEKTLIDAKSGKTIQELAENLIDSEINKNEAVLFVNQLIENQVLVSELELSITGENYFEQLVHRLPFITKDKKIVNQLLNLQSQIKKIDATIGNDRHLYDKIFETSNQISGNLDAKYLIQTECFSKLDENSLNKNIQKHLKKALILFNKMTLPTVNMNIVEFKRSFQKRYEQQEVPLNLAIDPEAGIGFGVKKFDGNSILDDFLLSSLQKRDTSINWSEMDEIILKKLNYAIEKKEYTIVLTESMFKEFSINWSDLPDTFSAIIETLDFEDENKNKISITGAGGASATNLLNRFCHGDKKLLVHTKEIIKIEKEINSNKILAEIVHLPEARTGNILQRPIMRKYEIPYLGKSNVKEEFQIPIDDILVSIRNDKIILRSKKLKKEILPRLGNAHNYGADSLPIYQFLCELQLQDKRSSISFQWSNIFKNYQFLPRVEFDNIIFSKARWNLAVEILEKIMGENNIIAAVNLWRKESQIPKYVQLVEGDNKLLVNLENENSISMLYSSVKRKNKFMLEEFLFIDNNESNNRKHCNQFVVSFYKKLESTYIKDEKK